MMTITEYIGSDFQLYTWLDTHLWSGAKDRWDGATPEQRWKVIDLICSIYSDADATEINDFVWFECDFIWYPDEGPADFTNENLFEGIEGY